MLADRPHGRRLTANEQRQLDELERRLLSGPLAPPHRVPDGFGGASRARTDRPLLVAGLIATAALLVLATIVGGPAGLAATTVTLLATVLVCALTRSTPLWRLRGRYRSVR